MRTYVVILGRIGYNLFPNNEIKYWIPVDNTASRKEIFHMHAATITFDVSIRVAIQHTHRRDKGHTQTRFSPPTSKNDPEIDND